MGLRKRSRKQQSQMRRTQPSRKSSLWFEQLETRALLSANPTLVLITHGISPFSGDGRGVQEPWQTDFANDISGWLSTYRSSHPLGSTGDTCPVPVIVGPANWDFGSVPTNRDVIAKVDWLAGSLPSIIRGAMFGLGTPIDTPAQQLANSINGLVAASPDNGQQWDILFIGHSRGAIFNNQVIADLQNVVGINRHVNSVEAIMLDPSGVPGDTVANVLSSLVDRAINYDDHLHIPFATDGLTFWQDNESHTACIRVPTADVNEPKSFWDYWVQQPLWQKFTPDGAGAALGDLAAQSIASHSAMPQWYHDSGNLETDFGKFLTDQPAIGDGVSTTKLSSISPEADGLGARDDYPQSLGASNKHRPKNNFGVCSQ